MHSKHSIFKLFYELKYRYIGVDGNRAIAVTGKTGNSMVSYFGKTWTKIVGDLPQNQSSTIFQIKEDPGKKGLLWTGTRINLSSIQKNFFRHCRLRYSRCNS